MAQSYTPTYQIILIGVFGLNVVFWILLLCWRFFCLDTMTSSLTRCRRAINSLASLSINVNQIHNFTIRGAVMRINSDLPPPYEQAIKYPSLSSISGQLAGNCNPIYIISSESNSNCFTQLNPAPSYFESQTSSLPLPQPQTSSSSSSTSSSSSSSSSVSSTKPIKSGLSSIRRSFSFGDVQSFKRFQQYLNNV